MNRVVAARTTAGLARYLLDVAPEAREKGVGIGYDGRKISKEAIQDAAELLTGHGIPVWIFPQVAPTPLTAFAVVKLDAAAGIMITASHNPPEYNGYKVYWGNGAQIVPPHDEGIAQAIEEVPPLGELPRLGEGPAKDAGLWRELGDDGAQAYLRSLAAHSITSDGKDRLTIVYTALHGVGGELALRAFRAHGFHEVHPVPEQFEPDAAFPTVRFPNPEEEGAMDLSLALAKEKGANLVLANDPDADRLAVAVPDPAGGFRLLSGNEIGLLLSSYFLESDRSGGDRLLITTIVSTPAAGAIAKEAGARYEEVLTGFKWIANKAMELEASTGTRFALGFEEALGYSIGTTCRDKDGIGAAVYFAELAAHLAARGRTVLELLEGIWRTHGLYLSHQHSVTLEGAEGSRQIRAIMDALRATPPTTIGGRAVERIKDYAQGLGLPPSNVLAFHLEDGTRLIARPSGTEPKIKYYIDLRLPVGSGEPIDEARSRGEVAVQELLADFLTTVDRSLAGRGP
jgi:phosphomannomutase